jgi:carbonic anhydrase/acetyltransferase-like protein (isoleucine patch superfamily)
LIRPIAGHSIPVMDLSDRLARYLQHPPTLHPTAWVAPTATIIGDVTLGAESSVWYGAVLRGDINRIVIGPRSNVQDGSVVHLADDLPTIVGEYVTVGHKAILHACTVGDEVLVGMGAIILDGAEIGARSILGAGALVTGGKKIPPGSLVLGSPAKVVRALTIEEQADIRTWAEKYVALSRHYRGEKMDAKPED